MNSAEQINGDSKNSQIEIYQNQDGNIKINVMLEENNVWLSQGQISRLFGKDRTTITEHIKLELMLLCLCLVCSLLIRV